MPHTRHAPSDRPITNWQTKSDRERTERPLQLSTESGRIGILSPMCTGGGAFESQDTPQRVVGCAVVGVGASVGNVGMLLLGLAKRIAVHGPPRGRSCPSLAFARPERFACPSITLRPGRLSSGFVPETGAHEGRRCRKPVTWCVLSSGVLAAQTVVNPRLRRM